MSVRTIKPSTTSNRSSSSLASLVAEKFRRQRSINTSQVLTTSTTNTDISTFPARILDGFHQISLDVKDDPAFADITAIGDRLRQVAEMGENLVAHMRSRIDEAAEELELMRGKFRQVDGVVGSVTMMVENTYGERFVEIEQVWDAPDSVRRRTTDSGDSESTAVSETGFVVLRKRATSMIPRKVDVGVSACVESEVWRASMPPVIVQPAPVDGRKVGSARSPLAEVEVNRLTPTGTADERGFLKLVSSWMKDLPRRRSKISLKMKSMENMRSGSLLPVDPEKKDSSKGKTKLKAWLKKKILPEAHSGLVIVRDLDEDGCPIGREVKGGRKAMSISVSDHPLRRRASKVVSSSRCTDRDVARRIITSCSNDLSRIQVSVHHVSFSLPVSIIIVLALISDYS